MAKPKIRHLAVVTRDPEALAKFYCSVFDMEIIHRSESRACFVSDGYLTVALLPHRLAGDSACGINHFGFQVDDIAEVAERLKAAGVEEPRQRPSNRPFAEFRGVDPAGNQFDLSAHGYDRVETRAEREKRLEKV